jgi:hypothetical protein
MALGSFKQTHGSEEGWLVEDEAEIWRVFSEPASDDQFCRAWLILLCRQLSNVAAGVVLFQSNETNTFIPVAVWPEAPRDLSSLGKIAERALIEGKGVVHRSDDAAIQGRCSGSGGSRPLRCRNAGIAAAITLGHCLAARFDSAPGIVKNRR